jgi:hypothetical protein
VTTANAVLAAANALGGLNRTYVVWQDLTPYQAAGTTPPALKLDASTLRIANALGFGRTQLQQVSWQELAPCPAGQTPPSGSTTC